MAILSPSSSFRWINAPDWIFLINFPGTSGSDDERTMAVAARLSPVRDIAAGMVGPNSSIGSAMRGVTDVMGVAIAGTAYGDASGGSVPSDSGR